MQWPFKIMSAAQLPLTNLSDTVHNTQSIVSPLSKFYRSQHAILLTEIRVVTVEETRFLLLKCNTHVASLHVVTTVSGIYHLCVSSNLLGLTRRWIPCTSHLSAPITNSYPHHRRHRGLSMRPHPASGELTFTSTPSLVTFAVQIKPSAQTSRKWLWIVEQTVATAVAPRTMLPRRWQWLIDEVSRKSGCLIGMTAQWTGIN